MTNLSARDGIFSLQRKISHLVLALEGMVVDHCAVDLGRCFQVVGDGW